MKKVKIDFDFSKWGQEGISVIIDSKNVFVIHKNPIKTTWYYGLYENGFAFFCLVGDITMYQEIKPREIWVNEYPNNQRAYVFWDTKEDAETKLLNCATPLRTIKFREVLEEPNETEKV